MNDGCELEFDLVIEGDGINSKTRKFAGIDYEGFDLDETWTIADVDSPSWKNTGAFTLNLLAKGGVAVVVQLEADRYGVVSNTENALSALELPMEVTKIHRQGQFKTSIRQANTYCKGRVYLAGDVAHCHSPVGGRGMNLGISDAAELARCVAEGQLDGYSEIRHQAGRTIIAQSERARKIVTSSNPFTRALVVGSCRMIDLIPNLQRKLATVFLRG